MKQSLSWYLLGRSSRSIREKELTSTTATTKENSTKEEKALLQITLTQSLSITMRTEEEEEEDFKEEAIWEEGETDQETTKGHFNSKEVVVVTLEEVINNLLLEEISKAQSVVDMITIIMGSIETEITISNIIIIATLVDLTRIDSITIMTSCQEIKMETGSRTMVQAEVADQIMDSLTTPPIQILMILSMANNHTTGTTTTISHSKMALVEEVIMTTISINREVTLMEVVVVDSKITSTMGEEGESLMVKETISIDLMTDRVIIYFFL